MKNFNAKEILEIAIQNEKNGVEFYSKLREAVKDDKEKEVLLDLIKQENEHIVTIKGLMNQLIEKNKKLDYYDDPDELLYLQAIADASIFMDEHKENYLNDILTNILAALHYAVRVEIKSIEFYKELLLVMSPKSGKETVKKLIEEEKGHVKNIYKMINEYKE